MAPAHNAALIQKQFVLNFMTSYMALLFTAFVYIPFGHILTPFLEFWRHTAQTITFSEKLPTQEFKINPARISNQMFYFTVTAQIVNFMTEVVVPYAKRQAFAKAKEFKAKDSVKHLDHPEETEFLERVRNECELEVYDVSGDYREMVMQFGKCITTVFQGPVIDSEIKVTFPSSLWLGLSQPAASSSTTGLSCGLTHSRSLSAAGGQSRGGPIRSARG